MVRSVWISRTNYRIFPIFKGKLQSRFVHKVIRHVIFGKFSMRSEVHLISFSLRRACEKRRTLGLRMCFLEKNRSILVCAFSLFPLISGRTGSMGANRLGHKYSFQVGLGRPVPRSVFMCKFSPTIGSKKAIYAVKRHSKVGPQI